MPYETFRSHWCTVEIIPLSPFSFLTTRPRAAAMAHCSPLLLIEYRWLLFLYYFPSTQHFKQQFNPLHITLCQFSSEANGVAAVSGKYPNKSMLSYDQTSVKRHRHVHVLTLTDPCKCCGNWSSKTGGCKTTHECNMQSG